jgi:excisionase family DNA binding protein
LVEDVALFTGLSQSYLYRLTSEKKIPHYRPRGKLLYFEATELSEWLLQNKVLTQVELEQKANNHIIQKSFQSNK